MYPYSAKHLNPNIVCIHIRSPLGWTPNAQCLTEQKILPPQYTIVEVNWSGLAVHYKSLPVPDWLSVGPHSLSLAALSALVYLPSQKGPKHKSFMSQPRTLPKITCDMMVLHWECSCFLLLSTTGEFWPVFWRHTIFSSDFRHWDVLLIERLRCAGDWGKRWNWGWKCLSLLKTRLVLTDTNDINEDDDSDEDDVEDQASWFRPTL